MPTMSLRSSGCVRAVEQRRRRVVLEVDHEFAVARRLAARRGEVREEAAAVFGESFMWVSRGCGADERARSDAFSATRLRTRRACSSAMSCRAGRLGVTAATAMQARWLPREGYRKVRRRRRSTAPRSRRHRRPQRRGRRRARATALRDARRARRARCRSPARATHEQRKAVHVEWERGGKCAAVRPLCRIVSERPAEPSCWPRADTRRSPRDALRTDC